MPAKPPAAALIDVMMVLQGPWMVPSETWLLVTAVSGRKDQILVLVGQTIYIWRKERRTDRGGWWTEVAGQGSEDTGYRNGWIGTLDQDIVLGGGERPDEGDTGESGESESKEARDKHCRY